jgi:hypothetical protein
MRQRGSKYQQWVASDLISQDRFETLRDGTRLHASAHIPAGQFRGMTLIFLGLYAAEGQLIFEECYGTWDDSHCEALDWATEMGKAWLTCSSKTPDRRGQ